MVTLIDLLNTTFAPVQTRVLFYLYIADMLTLARCSRQLDLRPILNATAFNINYHLSRFFADPKAFRSVQARCNALIVGRLVKELFAGGSRSKFLRMIVKHTEIRSLQTFIEANGYTTSYPDAEQVEYTKVNSGHTFRISVVRTTATVASEALRNAVTTAGLTFATWNKMYSLQPYIKYVERRSYAMSGPCDLLNDTFAKERKLGLETLSVDVDNKTFDRITRARRIGDKYTCIVKLDTVDLQLSSITDVVLQSTTFSMNQSSETSPGTSYRMSHYIAETRLILNQPVLRHKYTVIQSSRGRFGIYHDRIRPSSSNSGI